MVDVPTGDVALIVSVINLVAIVVAAFIGRSNNRKLDRLEISVDGKLAQLVSAEKGKSLLEGTAKGIASERLNPQVDKPTSPGASA